MRNTPVDSDRYPIKDLLADVREWFTRRDEITRMAAMAAIPQISRPFKGGFPVTQSYFADRHPAIDWGMPIGTALYAAHAGQVVKAGADSTGYGYVVVIKDDSRGLYTVYGHLNYQAAIVVRVGQWVAERQHIGNSGTTGNSTGPHLHFELRVPPYAYRTNCVNPLPYLAVWSDPTPPPPNPPPPNPPPPNPPPGSRCVTLRNSPVIKKKTGKKVGLYPAGKVLANVGGVSGDWTYVPGQYGQPDGWVKTANLRRL